MASRAHRTGAIHWRLNRGRDGFSKPHDVSPDMSTESFNVELTGNSLGRKRKGTQSYPGLGSATYSGYNQLFCFVLGQDTAAPTSWIVSNDGTTKILRVTSTGTVSNLTLKDNVATAPHLVRAAVLNGKVFFAYDSTVNRLHVDDGSTVRRVGFALPAAPSISNTGSGSYPAVLRYYRVQWLELSGTTVIRQSNLGTAVSFTPDGSGTHARVTQPTAASEGETHWAVWGSEDGVLYYKLSSNIVIATTTYDDNETPADYDVNDPAPDEGAFTPFPSVKMLLSTGDRLFGFGVWETSAGDSLTPFAGRVYFTPTLDSSDLGDDERVSNTVDFKGHIDIARNAGAEDRALAGPLNNQIMVFQSKGVYMLIPTGNADTPYRRVTLTTELGAVSQESTYLGEDEAGRPCVYFLDPLRGPYRYGARGFEWLGYDVQDLWATVNLGATTRVAMGVFDPEYRAAKFWIATGVTNTCTKELIFFAREGRSAENGSVRGGWAQWAHGNSETFICIALWPALFSSALGRSKRKPATGNTSIIIQWNTESLTTEKDGSTEFLSYVTSPQLIPEGMHKQKRTGRIYAFGKASSSADSSLQAVSMKQTLASYGTATTDAQNFTMGSGSVTGTVRKFHDIAKLTDWFGMSVTIDDSPTSTRYRWTLEEWYCAYEVLEDG